MYELKKELISCSSNRHFDGVVVVCKYSGMGLSYLERIHFAAVCGRACRALGVSCSKP